MTGNIQTNLPIWWLLFFLGYLWKGVKVYELYLYLVRQIGFLFKLYKFTIYSIFIWFFLVRATFVLFCFAFFVGFVFDIILFKYIFYNVFNMILNIFKCYIMQVSCFINFDHNVYREYITYIPVTNVAYRYMYIL